MDRHSPVVMMVLGRQRVGKTSFLNAVAQYLRSHGALFEIWDGEQQNTSYNLALFHKDARKPVATDPEDVKAWLEQRFVDVAAAGPVGSIRCSGGSARLAERPLPGNVLGRCDRQRRLAPPRRARSSRSFIIRHERSGGRGMRRLDRQYRGGPLAFTRISGGERSKPKAETGSGAVHESARQRLRERRPGRAPARQGLQSCLRDPSCFLSRRAPFGICGLKYRNRRCFGCCCRG